MDREGGATHSDDLQSWSYFNRAREVYEMLGVGERIEFAAATGGHRATSPVIDAAWQRFFERWLKEEPIGSPSRGSDERRGTRRRE